MARLTRFVFENSSVGAYDQRCTYGTTHMHKYIVHHGSDLASIDDFRCVGSELCAYLIVETRDMCLVESQDICLVETQDKCCVER